MRYILFVFTTLTFFSCFEDNFVPPAEEVNNVQFSGVDQRLWDMFEDFENEARARGVNIDLNELEITGEIQDIDDNGVAGQCTYGSHISHVTIDRNYWNSSSNSFREFIVFHELGHCALNRGHKEDAFDNGICRSIMRSGLEDCFDAYSVQNRAYYLDELFAFRQ